MLIYRGFSNWKTLRPSIINENNDINHSVIKLDRRKSDLGRMNTYFQIRHDAAIAGVKLS